jgi:hypothetical protein
MLHLKAVLFKLRCKPVRFETRPEQSGIVLIRVEFDADGMVDAFRRAFDLFGCGP